MAAISSRRPGDTPGTPLCTALGIRIQLPLLRSNSRWLAEHSQLANEEFVRGSEGVMRADPTVLSPTAIAVPAHHSEDGRESTLDNPAVEGVAVELPTSLGRSRSIHRRFGRLSP
jgi:hypothetical protein